MIYTVTFNPSLDYIIRVENLRLGVINRTYYENILPGGKGINVAVVAGRLGLDVQCIGIMGENGASELTAMMDREGLRHQFMTVPGHVRTNMKVYSLDGQGVTELNEPGTPLTPEMIGSFTDLAIQTTKDSDMVVLTGSLPPGCPEGTYRDLMTALNGKKCILDTEGKELELAAKGARPFLIKPNLREIIPLRFKLGRFRTIILLLRVLTKPVLGAFARRSMQLQCRIGHQKP